jgi:signal-transduction protein with cAMP-binding, CBS, and nucleotidyltransferase domain
VISVGPDDTLLTAFQRMRLADVSQLPVLVQGRLVGVIDESDILLGVHADAAHFTRRSQRHDRQTANPAARASLASCRPNWTAAWWRSSPTPRASMA